MRKGLCGVFVSLCLLWGCGDENANNGPLDGADVESDADSLGTDESDSGSDAGAVDGSDGSDGGDGSDVADGSDGDVTPVATGAELYDKYCSLCHGKEGEGFVADGANQLANQNWLSISSDEFIRLGIERGRPGTSMSAWGESRGGPLNDTELDRLTAHIRAWQTVDSIDVSDVTVEGEVFRGELVYEFKCASCHGDVGQGSIFMSVNNPEFLTNVSDGYLQHSIAKGRPGTAMAAYESDLTQQQIDDLVVLLRSWESAVDNSEVKSPDKDLGDNVVLNPDGAEPEFPGDGHFIGVDDLKAAMDAGNRMVIIDARPGSDYVESHITGAVSVPFYAVEEYLDQLPIDEWYVTYCACPHAESEAAAKTLENNGYTKVRVLNEGFNVWTEKGYPVEALEEE